VWGISKRRRTREVVDAVVTARLPPGATRKTHIVHACRGSEADCTVVFHALFLGTAWATFKATNQTHRLCVDSIFRGNTSREDFSGFRIAMVAARANVVKACNVLERQHEEAV
jgi:hypothetical protein